MTCAICGGIIASAAKKYGSKWAHVSCVIAFGKGQADGVETEREACAKLAEGGSFLHAEAPDAKFGRACAQAIRERRR